MKSIITNCFLVVLSLTHPFLPSAQSPNSPFTTPSSLTPVSGPVPAISHFTCSIRDKKIFLEWILPNNQDTDQFELERSTDGKNFVLAALLFGTDKTGTDHYQFYEKARTAKTYYRIRVIQKDGSIVYSAIVVAKK